MLQISGQQELVWIGFEARERKFCFRAYSPVVTSCFFPAAAQITIGAGYYGSGYSNPRTRSIWWCYPHLVHARSRKPACFLNCSWAGRPHWFYQALASGESIGYCAKETKNAQFNNGCYGSLGESGAHMALLGDPTVRAHIVAPAQNLTTSIENCGDVVLICTASADAGILGYNLYRSTSPLSGFARLNSTLLTGTTYTDANPVTDTMYYQVRAVLRQTSPGGGAYLNNSTGVQTSLIYQTPYQPVLTLSGGTFTCVTDSVWIFLSTDQPLASAVWNGPGVSNVSGDSLLVTQPGMYTVWAMAQNGCSASKSITTSLDVVPPAVNATGGVITCNEPTVTLSGFVSPGSTFVWSGPGVQQPDSLNPEVSVPGLYTLVVTAPNGCTGTDFVEVFALPNDLGLEMTASTVNCDNDSFGISPLVTGGVAPFRFLWYNGATSEMILVPTEDLPNVGVTITDVNGCVASFNATDLIIVQPPPTLSLTNIVLVDVSAPDASDGSISVNAIGGIPPYQYLWSNGEQTNTISNLGAGFYTVTINDASGCTYATSYPIGISGTQDPLSVLRFDLTPNPGYGPLTLHLELAAQADLYLLVFDASGKLVLENSGIHTDVLTLPLNLEAETPGMYTFLMRIDGSLALRRWVLLR